MMNIDKLVKSESNAAKILGAYIAATGITSTRELSEVFGIPIRTIQHLKREIGAKGCALGAQDVAFDAQGVAPAQDVAAQRVASDTQGVAQKTQRVAPLARAYSNITTTRETNTVTSNVTVTDNCKNDRTQFLRELQERLMDAAGAAANQASPGIYITGEVAKWIEDGADLDLDILPIVRAKAAKMNPGKLSGWGYFRDAVAEAKHNRERGLPVKVNGKRLKPAAPPVTEPTAEELEKIRAANAALDQQSIRRRKSCEAQATSSDPSASNSNQPLKADTTRRVHAVRPIDLHPASAESVFQF